MSWTAPITWASNELVTAALLNQQLRDNFLELDAAKATKGGRMLVSSAANSLGENTPMANNAPSLVTTSSFAYVTLGSSTPSVTLTTGTTALVLNAAEMYNDTTGGQEWCSYKVTGASALNASDNWALECTSLTANYATAMASCHLQDALTAGTNTFVQSYRTGGGLAQFDLRTIVVLPM